MTFEKINQLKTDIVNAEQILEDIARKQKLLETSFDNVNKSYYQTSEQISHLISK